MGILLPEKFRHKMKGLLGEEFEAFLASYERPRKYGLRVNTLKLETDQFLRISPFAQRLTPVPWTKEAFYYEEQDRPGKHPHYHAGLYYIQEPSAMVPAELLDVQPGDRVLDLCAAPGGKSTQLAAKLQGRGVLVTNDNARERTKALAKNVELAGVRNAIVLNEEPAAIARVFEGWFDRILVDAPCSGEGMFRKDESMIAEWEKHSVERCSLMQKDILQHAAAMLAPGGTLVYSTCTFSPEENEWQIARLLADHPEMEVEAVELRYGWAAGRPDWISEELRAPLSEERLASVAGTVRLWPHLTEGEGHYAAVLRKRLTDASDQPIAERQSNRDLPDESAKQDSRGQRKSKSAPNPAGRDRSLRSEAKGAKGGRDRHSGQKLHKREAAEVDPVASWQAFASGHLPTASDWPGRLVAFGSRLYLQPYGIPSLDGLHVVRAGWYLGEAGAHRFSPSHPLALGLREMEAGSILELLSDESDTLRYLKGETLALEPDRLPVAKGYVLVCVDHQPIGWGKYSGDGMLKNELPAGWRWM
ncbi:NOL1/NOP2/sun family putative RNA methylase [Paenibacillus phyllosphaerae]|uniref:NOL1/NOP2/sun family putative RNA methylase n=1 Tax=Paenibacillus phyllosphaerae TaxID=274593 RepID=A0A7W5AWQ1_9BACL|nr:RsmB/NOP family class I SAM-dependent RNA methyltransferase [Paenibacillus phyllosphaerae]MBB3109982.1 NOL1/NOP2/sun family putative RNA methylase [Paenibacillus phyllosphaerae]